MAHVRVKAIVSFDEFKNAINDEVNTAIIDFWATWCGPCRVISPIFETMAGNVLESRVRFYSVDVDAQPDIAKEVGIRAMPTFIAFRKGLKVKELVGANPPALQLLVNDAVNYKPEVSGSSTEAPEGHGAPGVGEGGEGPENP